MGKLLHLRRLPLPPLPPVPQPPLWERVLLWCLLGATLLFVAAQLGGCGNRRLVVRSTGEDLGAWISGTVAHDERLDEAINYANGPRLYYPQAFCEGPAVLFVSSTGHTATLGDATSYIGHGHELLRPVAGAVVRAPVRSVSLLRDGRFDCTDHLLLDDIRGVPCEARGVTVAPHPAADLEVR